MRGRFLHFIKLRSFQRTVGTILIGLGEYAVTTQPGDTIRTFGLGSCVSIVAIHSNTGAVGMVHIVLPESTTNLDKARGQPGYFADTAVPALFDELDKRLGKGRYIIKLVGGAAVIKSNVELQDALNIGKRNILATKKALWKRGLGALAEDVGGDQSRSVSVTYGSPQVEIKLGNQLIKML